MWEFNVFLDGEKVSEGVISARADGGRVVLTDTLRTSEEVQNCLIREVDVTSQRLVLSTLQRPSRRLALRGLSEILGRAAEFHGHLGPFLAIGVRMGLFAKRILKSNGFGDLRVVVNTGDHPPLSCVVDGIQVATGCTLGKGNVAVRNLGEVSAVFRAKRRAIRVKMKTEVFQNLEKELLNGDPEKMEKTAREVSSIPDLKLFDMEE